MGPAEQLPDDGSELFCGAQHDGEEDRIRPETWKPCAEETLRAADWNPRRDDPQVITAALGDIAAHIGLAGDRDGGHRHHNLYQRGEEHPHRRELGIFGRFVSIDDGPSCRAVTRRACQCGLGR